MTTLKNYMIPLSFPKARELVLHMTPEQLREELLELANEQGDLRTYSFVSYLLSEQETSAMHGLAATLMIQPLCHLPGAYHTAYYHVKRAIELYPNDVSAMEMMLFLFQKPEQLVSQEEVVKYLNRIMSLDANNKAVEHFISLYPQLDTPRRRRLKSDAKYFEVILTVFIATILMFTKRQGFQFNPVVLVGAVLFLFRGEITAWIKKKRS